MSVYTLKSEHCTTMGTKVQPTDLLPSIAEIIPQECMFNGFLYTDSIVVQPQNEYHE